MLKNIFFWIDNFVCFDMETIKHSTSNLSLNNSFNFYVYALSAQKYNFNNPHISCSKSWWTNYPLFSLEENNDMLISLFLKWLYSFGENLTVWSHNGGKFDLVFLLNFLKKHSSKHLEPYFDFLSRNNIVYLVNIFFPHPFNKNIKLKLTFLDSLNFFPSSLNDLGNFFNIKKSSLNHDLITLNLLTTIDHGLFKKKILAHVITDVKILFELIKFYYTFIINDIKQDPKYFTTLSSLSFSIFNKKYLKENSLSVPEDVTLKGIRESYIGGRSDIFIPFTDEIGYEYDINSLYPYVMRNNLFPVGESTFISEDNSSIDPSLHFHSFDFGFAQVTVNILDHFLPPLQIVHPTLLKNVNPIGTVTNWFFIDEIKNSVDNCQIKIIRIHKKILYAKKENIFKEFIDFFYTKRINCKHKLQNIFYKNLLNSLSGRFGIHSTCTFIQNYHFSELTYSLKNPQFFFESILFSDAPEWYFKNSLSKQYTFSFPHTSQFNQRIQFILDFTSKHPIEEMLYLNNFLYSLLESYKSKVFLLYPSPQISSAITAYGRIFMQNVMLKILKTNYIYYTDTDSIYIKYPLENSYISDIDLGKFKLVNVFKKAYFVATKVYCLILLNGIELIKFKGLDSIFKESLFSFPFNFWNSCLSFSVKEQQFKLNYKSFQRSKKNVNMHFTHALMSIVLKQDFIYLFNNKTNTKRTLVYDHNNVWIRTQPLKIFFV